MQLIYEPEGILQPLAIILEHQYGIKRACAGHVWRTQWFIVAQIGAQKKTELQFGAQKCKSKIVIAGAHGTLSDQI